MDRRLGHRETGFTLIELMIAVTVLALLTTTVSLSVYRPRGGTAADDARFRAVHAQLREQAVLSRQVLGLRLDAEGYQRLRWTDGDWAAAGAAARWRGAVTVLQPFRRDSPLQFVPSGQVTPVRLRFGGGEAARLCESDGWAEVTCRGG